MIPYNIKLEPSLKVMYTPQAPCQEITLEMNFKQSSHATLTFDPCDTKIIVHLPGPRGRLFSYFQVKRFLYYSKETIFKQTSHVTLTVYQHDPKTMDHLQRPTARLV